MDEQCACKVTVERMIRTIEKLEEGLTQGHALSYLREAAEMLRSYQMETGKELDNG